jgi:hypothetical protein
MTEATTILTRAVVSGVEQTLAESLLKRTSSL